MGRRPVKRRLPVIGRTSLQSRRHGESRRDDREPPYAERVVFVATAEETNGKLLRSSTSSGPEGVGRPRICIRISGALRGRTRAASASASGARNAPRPVTSRSPAGTRTPGGTPATTRSRGDRVSTPHCGRRRFRDLVRLGRDGRLNKRRCPESAFWGLCSRASTGRSGGPRRRGRSC